MKIYLTTKLTGKLLGGFSWPLLGTYLLFTSTSLYAIAGIEFDSLFTFKDTDIERIDYEGYRIFLDCSERAARAFVYIAKKDTGNYKRSSRFYIDKNLPASCQQKHSGSYRTKGIDTYDRGHLVPANHLDYSKRAILESNYVTNMLPQVKQMNRGAWLKTEELVECYRDIESLLVMGGPIWLSDTRNDYFIESHGVRTPEYYWKLVVNASGSTAWIIPNSKTATKGKLDSYTTSVAIIERLAGIKIHLPNEMRHTSTRSWGRIKGCDRS